MRRSKAEVDRYISSVQSASPSQKQKSGKGFLFARLYFEAKEYELAQRHVQEYLSAQPKDPKAHKFLGQLFEREGETDKAVGCYKRSVDLNPAQSDLVLKVAELLCGKPEPDSRAEFWVEKAAKLLPGHPSVFNLRETFLSTRGQNASIQLYELLQSELRLRPDDTYINLRLVRLYSADGRHEEALKHCLAVEKTGLLRDRLEWYELLVSTLQECLCQPSVASNEQASRKLHRELLLALCSRVRLTLTEKSCEESADALWSLDRAMQSLKNTATNTLDGLSEVFTETRAQLYLYAGTLLLKMAQDGAQQWRAVQDLAALCYLVSYQNCCSHRNHRPAKNKTTEKKIESSNEAQSTGSQEKRRPRLVRSNSMEKTKPDLSCDPDRLVKSDSDVKSEEITRSKPFITDVHQETAEKHHHRHHHHYHQTTVCLLLPFGSFYRLT